MHDMAGQKTELLTALAGCLAFALLTLHGTVSSANAVPAALVLAVAGEGTIAMARRGSIFIIKTIAIAGLALIAFVIAAWITA